MRPSFGLCLPSVLLPSWNLTWKGGAALGRSLRHLPDRHSIWGQARWSRALILKRNSGITFVSGDWGGDWVAGTNATCSLSLSVILEAIEALPLANTPEVFGLHSNAEIGYYTQAARDMWGHLLELQPQTGMAARDLVSLVGGRGCSWWM